MGEPRKLTGWTEIGSYLMFFPHFDGPTSEITIALFLFTPFFRFFLLSLPFFLFSGTFSSVVTCLRQFLLPLFFELILVKL